VAKLLGQSFAKFTRKSQRLPANYFQTKKNNWVNFGGPWNGKVWYILWPFGIYTFCGHLMIWLDIFSHFGIICIKKNLATLLKKAKERRIHM
jgi:hypothetical protein